MTNAEDDAPGVRVHAALEVPELSPEEAREAVERALEHGGRSPAGVEVVLVDDATLAELHERFLDDPAPTDVMAFDLSDADEGPQAEIYVSVDRAREVARARGGSVRAELALYLVHGALHLCGYDDRHPPERRRMRRAEAEVLRRLGFSSDEAHAPDDESGA